MRSYNGAPREHNPPEGQDPIGFVLNNETFLCVAPQCPAWARSHIAPGRLQIADGLIAFIRGCLIPEHEDAFDDALRDKESIVDVHLLARITDDLIEQYANRPSLSPPSSPNGPSGGDLSSTATSGSPASANAT